jgi:hypothetical protein
VFREREGGVQVAVEDKVPVQIQGRAQSLRPDKWVAVLVAADPGAELEDAPQGEILLGEVAGELVFEFPVNVEG